MGWRTLWRASNMWSEERLVRRVPTPPEEPIGWFTVLSTAAVIVVPIIVLYYLR